jgi:hypothetical protein
MSWIAALGLVVEALCIIGVYGTLVKWRCFDSYMEDRW